jgi:serine protease Do
MTRIIGGIMSIDAVMPAVPRGIACMLAVSCFVLVATPALAHIPEFSRGNVPTLAPLVREITPSVVNLSVHGRVKEDNSLDRDAFRQFFDAPKEVEREIQAVGSGIIVDAQRGYVLTANHVVARVSTVQVTTKDGRRFVAKLVGRDVATDVAVLRLQGAQRVKAIPMGDSDSVEVGDFVMPSAIRSVLGRP